MIYKCNAFLQHVHSVSQKISIQNNYIRQNNSPFLQPVEIVLMSAAIVLELDALRYVVIYFKIIKIHNIQNTDDSISN